MKISEIEIIPLSIPLVREEPISDWVERLSKQIIVLIHTDDGITGIGESFSYGAQEAVVASLDKLKPFFVGKEFSDPSELCKEVNRLTYLYTNCGVGLWALAGIEIALCDIMGKIRSLPLYKVFGGRDMAALPSYVSLLRYSSPKEVGKVVEKYISAGFKGVKLHETDLESVRECRVAVGDDVYLMLDPNSPWSVEEALKATEELRPQNLFWLEEPIWPPEDYEGLSRVGKESGITIASGENESSIHGFKRMIKKDAADVIQPSVTKIGVWRWIEAVRLALSNGKSVAPHSFYLGPGFIATLHLASILPPGSLVEIPGFSLETPLFEEKLEIEKGVIKVPQGAGLGVTFNKKAREKYSL